MFRLVVVVLGAVLSFQVNAITMGEAIDRAGQQRMLSQRVAQAYLLKGIQPNVDRHQKQLDRSIQKFQENLIKLQRYQNIKAERAQLDKVVRLWTDYKALVVSTPSKDNAREIIQKSNVLLGEAHEYVQRLQKLSGLKGAELVNVSGRQRMLSQRLAKNYLATYWSVGEEKTLSQFYEDIAEFQTMLNYLKSSDINTMEITKNLLKTEGHFKYASKGFDGDMTLKGDRLIFVITGTTDTMLRNMDVITKQYASVLDNSNGSVASR